MGMKLIIRCCRTTGIGSRFCEIQYQDPSTINRNGSSHVLMDREVRGGLLIVSLGSPDFRPDGNNSFEGPVLFTRGYISEGRGPFEVPLDYWGVFTKGVLKYNQQFSNNTLEEEDVIWQSN